MLSINSCPICGNHTFIPKLTCKDYTVSHETFTIVTCSQCDFHITSPRPEEEDLGKYYLSDNYISHSKKTKSIVDLIYRTSRLFTLSWKLNLVFRYASKSKNISLLDYGCGTGDFLLHAKKKGIAVTGVEPSDTARNITAEKLHQKIYSSINQLTSTFDVITLWHVLEHIPDINEKLLQLQQHLNENGTMFIAVPNHQSPDALRFTHHWAGYDVPRHLWHFSQNSMTSLLQKHTLKVKAIVPMKLDAYYVSILSNRYRGSSSITGLLGGLIEGMKSNRSAKKSNNYSSLIYVATK